MPTRRRVLQLFGLSLLPAAQVIGQGLPRPNPELFQTGDFLWPKPPGAYIPYNSGNNNSPEQDARLWESERTAYVRRTDSSADRLVNERVRLLRSMDYREFLAVYEGNQRLGVPGAYSGGSFYVGHVALLEIRGGVPYIIEALMNKGVVESSYDVWIKGRSDHVVWLGRLRGKTQDERARIAAEARRHLGRPYDFWNFDLNDDAGFYCSKLCWLSTYRALNVSLDNDLNPKRLLWYSPKQFLSGPNTEKLHDPGPYASA